MVKRAKKVKPMDGVDPRWAVVGKRIAEDRKAKDIGQAELGRKIGLQTPSSMWRYEAGQVPIPIPRIEQIAEALGTRPERYMPTRQAMPKREPLTAEQLRDLHARLAKAAMEAAMEATPAALERLNALIAEHVARH